MREYLPGCIINLLFELDHQPNMNNDLVSQILSGIKLSEEALEPYVFTNHPVNESYGRKLIWDNGDYKILLMTWHPGDFTAIHNHGYTEWGGVYFFGEATHRLYHVENNELTLIQKNVFPNGQVASICGDLTHLMGNAGNRDIITLHVYGSNTRKENVSEDAKVYVPEFQKVFTTMGSAYLNMNKALILSEMPFENIEHDLLADYFSLVKPFYERNKMAGVLKRMDNYLNHN
jgi:hypothetical protein